MLVEETAYVGPVDLSGTLTFGFITRNTSEVPTNADAAVTYDIYAANMGSKIVTGGTATAISGEAGGYYISETIGSGSYASGSLYTIIIKYAITTARRRVFTFSVT